MTIGLLGLGTIGSGIYEHLKKRGDIRVKRILELLRHPGLEDIETSDYSEILNDPEIDTVVELIGGLEPAHTFTVQALKAGKNVVSANKLMISRYLEELLDLAKQNGVQYRFDASVGGSIPLLHNLARHASADRIISLSGILNGTTNLILDRMQEAGLDFADALKEAQERGYAEADPSADIDGIDARSKITIASSIAYGQYVDPDDVDTAGIRQITGDDLIYFRQMNRVCRLLAVSQRLDGAIAAYVEPALVGTGAIEAAVRANNNTVAVVGEYFGAQNFQGQGAGKDPTAFAVELGLRDIMDGVPPMLCPMPSGRARVDNDAASHCYYLRTAAEPGVPAEVLGACGTGKAYVTGPMSVREMHALAKRLRAQDENTFFAGIRD